MCSLGRLIQSGFYPRTSRSQHVTLSLSLYIYIYIYVYIYIYMYI